MAALGEVLNPERESNFDFVFPNKSVQSDRRTGANGPGAAITRLLRCQAGVRQGGIGHAQG